MTEIWKDIEGYEGLYQVSNMGRIKSLKYNNGSTIYDRELIRKPNQLKNGYCNIILNKNGKAKAYRIHRLVAKAFVPNPENKDQINHINMIKNDNRAENLEWVTGSENMLKCYQIIPTTSPKKSISSAINVRKAIAKRVANQRARKCLTEVTY